MELVVTESWSKKPAFDRIGQQLEACLQSHRKGNSLPLYKKSSGNYPPHHSNRHLKLFYKM